MKAPAPAAAKAAKAPASAPEAPAAPAPDYSWHKTQLKISERVTDPKTKVTKTVFQRFVTYGSPALSDMSRSCPHPDSFASEVLKEGGVETIITSPVYNDPKLQYLQDALTQRIQALARSRAGAGHDQIMSWQELEEASGQSKYPQQLKLFRAAFAEWLVGAGEYSDQQAAAICSYLAPQKLMVQKPERKERFAAVAGKFITSLGDDAAEYTAVINNINKALETKDEELDW